MQSNHLRSVSLVPDFMEEQFRKVSSFLVTIPRTTNAGSWFLRLVHFPEGHPEVVWDIEYAGRVGRITKSKFSQQVRDIVSQISTIYVENGVAELEETEPLIVEVNSGLCWQCTDIVGDLKQDVYFLYYCEGTKIHKVLAENIRKSESAEIEPWRRLINRITGSALLIPR